MVERILLIITDDFPDYALLDSGNGRKLEQFGSVTVNRPEPQAMWLPRQADEVWQAANGVFGDSTDSLVGKGRWFFRSPPPVPWQIQIDGIIVNCWVSAFCHLGIFPEQYSHWRWIVGMIQRIGLSQPRLLNLFGYTGVASLLAVMAGAEVTHVDASRTAIKWARLNQTCTGLEQAPIRWILNDARAFASREVRRQQTYHGILLDPPKFGRGPNGEVWNLFRDLPSLLRTCERLLEPRRAFLVLTTYAIRASSLSFDLLVREALSARGGYFESGELLLREVGARRVLSTSLFTRWMSNDF